MRSTGSPRLRTLLTAVAAALLLGASLEPKLLLPRRTFDYIVTLDITQSMNTRDTELGGVRMSRVRYAKRLLQRLLERLPCGSKLGWAVFTEYRVFLLFTPVEVCANYDELSTTLARLDNNMAWAGGSNIARGLFAGLDMAAHVPGHPAFVFITDGQEAPPMNPEFAPQFPGTPGAVRGVILGVGGPRLARIPMIGRDGRFLGYWSASEVPQTDAYSAGRATSVPGELLYNKAGQPIKPRPPTGTEQLSSLKANYLRALARQTGLAYHHLDGFAALDAALTGPGLGRRVYVRTAVGYIPAALALVLLLWLSWPALARRSMRRAAPPPNRARATPEPPSAPAR